MTDLFRNETIFGRVLDKYRSDSGNLGLILEDYQGKLLTFKSTLQISLELNKIFKPINQYLKTKKMVFISTDEDMEMVPYEIIGDKIMQEESHNIVYLATLSQKIPELSIKNFNVTVLGEKNERTIDYLEKIAIKETGIDYQVSDSINEGIGHFHSKVTYKKNRGEFFVGKRP